jgi:4-hydroxy-tetrahydrodipicolinate reductase
MKIALIGYGKMGRAIEQLSASAGHQVLARVNSGDAAEWTDVAQCDVAIEFTNPDSAPGNLLTCLQMGIPVVTGSTGWYRQLPEIKQQFEQQQGALLYASNFSIGVNLMMEVNRVLAGLMNKHDQYQVSMTETHHTQKLDAPSGTAITLAEDLISALDRKTNWVNSPAEAPEALEIISHREPEVPGTHTITWSSDCDEIQLTHRALNRDGFARGALLAAEWLQGKRGVFTIHDVLNLNPRT